MNKNQNRFEIILLAILVLGLSAARAADQDPMACLQDIERICVHLEDKLETCLADRGDQLSASCRDELKNALSVMQDPSGPVTCVSDIQRLCPDLKNPDALSKCIADNQSAFSAPCQKYLQSAGPEKTVPTP